MRLLKPFLVPMCALAGFAPAVHSDTFGPSGGAGLSGEYASGGDSPFNGIAFNYFYLENFEDGALDTVGVSTVGGRPLGPSGATDSVDLDDGVLDGFGRQGWSYWSSNVTDVTFSFDASALGRLPSHVGLVMTHSVGPTTIDFIDAQGQSIITFDALEFSQTVNGSTANDRFVGAFYLGGISGLRVSAGAFELDHLQYGVVAVPEPSTYAMFACGLGVLVGMARKRDTL